ncbi:MAG: hypothetical protein ACPGUH_00980 [Winogradskyella sp.]
MKLILKFSTLAFAFLTILSCDAIDDLTEFNINDDFTTTFNVSVEEAPMSFNETATISIASNQEIQDNIDLIQNVTINAITYEISNFTGAEGAIVTEASLNIGNSNIAVADINLLQSDTDNTVYTIENSSTFTDIGNTLQNDTSITASVTGTVNNVPVAFNVVVTIDVTVTIDVL